MFCSFIDGLFFYLLIVYTSIIFGILVSMIINFGTQRFKVILFIGIFIFICLIPLLEIYFLPQVYFYSPLIGFFPGNIYDEALSPDLKLFFHQFIIIVFSFAVIYILLKKKDLIELHKKEIYFKFYFSNNSIPIYLTILRIYNYIFKVRINFTEQSSIGKLNPAL